jgi:hypothetical protein
VKYILSRLDMYWRRDATVDYDAMTIEHIAAQNPDAGTSPANVGMVGNLVLVPETLNSKSLANKSFDKKKVELKKAKVTLDDSLQNATSWGETEITARTLALAKIAQGKVFKV